MEDLVKVKELDVFEKQVRRRLDEQQMIRCQLMKGKPDIQTISAFDLFRHCSPKRHYLRMVLEILGTLIHGF